MADFLNQNGDPIFPNVGIDASFFAYLNTPLDLKVCNFYRSGNDIVFETIAEYLVRVTLNDRVPGIPVTVFLPKDGYTLLPSYPLDTFQNELINFDIKYYGFVDGLADINFVELQFGSKWHTEADTLTNLSSKTVNVTFKKQFKTDFPTKVSLNVYRMYPIGVNKYTPQNVVFYHSSLPFYNKSGFSFVIESFEDLNGVIVEYCFMQLES